MTPTIDAPSTKTTRFERKREMILEAASAIINELGVKGMGFADVAERVGLTTTSVTYYFRKKEDLAFACFDLALDHIEGQVAKAEAEPVPQRRVARFVQINFDHFLASRQKTVSTFARMSDIRAMEDPLRQQLQERYRAIFRRVRALLGEAEGEKAQSLRTIRAHVLMEVLYWVPAWIMRYGVADYGRVYDRFMEVFNHGLAPAGSGWSPTTVPLVDAEEDGGPARRNFLMAATRLINDRGYRGASVDRIASELNVTKGSFYHHLEAKDDLVLECFRRSLSTISNAQHASDRLPGSHLHKLESAVATLLAFQFSDSGPLLRTTALQAIPAEMRFQVIDRSNRTAGRFADMMIDAISEGSIRPVDPLIASQMLMAALNSAYEQRRWASTRPLDEAVQIYASVLFSGLIDPE